MNQKETIQQIGKAKPRGSTWWWSMQHAKAQAYTTSQGSFKTNLTSVITYNRFFGTSPVVLKHSFHISQPCTFKNIENISISRTGKKESIKSSSYHVTLTIIVMRKRKFSFPLAQVVLTCFNHTAWFVLIINIIIIIVILPT